MAGAVLTLPNGEPVPLDPPASAAPALPTDGHLVAAAMAAQRLRDMANALASIMQASTRDAALFNAIHTEILTEWCAVGDSYGAYQAVLSCEGQA